MECEGDKNSQYDFGKEQDGGNRPPEIKSYCKGRLIKTVRQWYKNRLMEKIETEKDLLTRIFTY